jgi:hypothetical protein
MLALGVVRLRRHSRKLLTLSMAPSRSEPAEIPDSGAMVSGTHFTPAGLRRGGCGHRSILGGRQRRESECDAERRHSGTKKVNELGVDVLITGQAGPKVFATLRAGIVTIYAGAAGPEADAIKQFKSSKLKAAGSADIEGHWV